MTLSIRSGFVRWQYQFQLVQRMTSRSPYGSKPCSSKSNSIASKRISAGITAFLLLMLHRVAPYFGRSCSFLIHLDGYCAVPRTTRRLFVFQFLAVSVRQSAGHDVAACLRTIAFEPV